MLNLTLLAADEFVTDGQLWTLMGSAAAVFAAVLVVLYTTRAGIVARATTKEAVRQPVFFLMLFIGMALLVLNTFLPFFTLGDDFKMLKDCGLATLLISSLLLAVWTASNGISAEIEGKTTMTLLSKPLDRRQFIIGKYLGVLMAVLFLMIPLSITFLSLVYFKIGYDAREASREVPAMFNWVTVNWLPFEFPQPTPARWFPMVQVVPGVILIFFEAMILTAISIALSTRVPTVVNIVTCLTVYIVGHLAPVLVMVSAKNELMETVQFISRLIATVLPALEAFNTQTSVATGKPIPLEYIGYAALYCAIYSLAGILTAFFLFDDRDLA